MALVVKDRVRETSTTTGTGTFTLAGAVTGYQAFSAVGDGNTTYYTIYLQGGNEWEVGIGTYTASGTTLSRDTILASSNAGSAVNFSAGTKDVFVTYPAGRSVWYDSATNVTLNALTVTGALAANGGTTIGDAAGDAFTINSSAVSTPNGLNFDSNTLVVNAANDRVGIGVASPAYKLDIEGTVRIGTGGSIQPILSRSGTSGGLIINTTAASAAGPLAVQDNGVDRLVIDQLGNVLIGTATNTNSSKLVASGTISETVSSTQYLVASQFDIGTAANEIPLNQYLGNLAYQDAGSIAGQVGLSAGTAALPSLVSATDTDTGMWFPAANTLAWSTGGTRAITVTSSQNVGIGTDSPGGGARLHVDASGGGIVRVTRLASSATAYGQLENDGTNSTLTSSAALIFNAGGSSERARITSGGDLEIATGKVVTSISGTNAGFQWGGTTVTSRLYDDGSGTVYLDVGAGASNATVPLVIRTKGGSVAFNNGTSQVMTLLASGNLGIGETNPAYKLDVAGSGASTLFRINNATTGKAAMAFANNGTVAGAVALSGWWEGDSSTDMSLIAETGYGLRFYTNGSPTEKAVIDTSGNLGLGVTPSAWSGYTALQVGSGFTAWSSGVANARINANTYYNGGYKYVGTGTATMYEQDGYHAWYNAPSGTANSASVTSGKSYTVVALGTTTLAQWQAFFNDSSNNPLTVTPTLGQVLTGNATGTLLGGGLVTQNISFTQAMTLDASGNLGVGATSPNFRLEVRGGVATNGDAIRNMAVISTNSATAGLGGGIAFGGYYNGTTNDITDFAGIQGFKENGTAGDYAGALRFTTRVNGGTPTERARITSGGYLGISTNNPLNYLDLGQSTNGNGLTWGNYSNIFSEYSSGALILSSNYYGNIGSGGYKTTLTATFGAAGIQVSGTSGAGNGGLIQFFVDPATAKTAGNAFTPTERARIDPDGTFRVKGAGTAGSTDAFQVAGAAPADAARITSGGNLCVGSTSSTYRLGVTTNSGGGIQVVTAGATTGNPSQDWYDSTNLTEATLTTGNSLISFGSYTNTPLALITNNTERARITSGGDLLVGNNPTNIRSSKFVVGNAIGGGTGAEINNTDSSSWISLAFHTAGTLVGYISNTTTTTAYNTSSDYRLKNNQQPLTGSGAFIDALKPKTWDWKSGGKGVGFIAHEVQAVSPGTVVGEKDAVDADGKPIMQAMEYGSAEFIANIIAELQSLRARVAQLEQGA